MPHQLVLNYLSSKTNFVFNQIKTPFRERYAVMTPSNFFKDPFERVIQRKAEFYLVNLSNPEKPKKFISVFY